LSAADVVDGAFPEGDATWTDEAGRVCAVLVADCMPVLFCDRDGSRVAAAHAGWRGLAGGVLEATLDAGGFAPEQTMAWLGPSIGPTRFEVGADVLAAFVDAAGSTTDDATDDAVDDVVAAFTPHAPGKWLADLPALARIRLRAAGVHTVHACGLCTMSDAERFYSYRRDRVTGRMAALVWIED
jgi:YfiH family protein